MSSIGDFFSSSIGNLGNLFGAGPGTVDPSSPQYTDPEQQYYPQYASMLNQLVSNPSQVQNTPWYQFQLQQGTQAVEGGAAAKGQLNSGNTLGALQQLGQGQASSAYQQQLTDLFGLAQGNPAYGNLGLSAQNSNLQGDESVGKQWMSFGAGAAGSDRRLKNDIKQVGRLDNGLPVYAFRYKGSDVMQLGLMADDVESLHPEAVEENEAGFKGVRYELAVE